MASTKPSTLKLEPATVEDIPDITNVWYAAFSTPAMLALFPDTPAVRRWWEDANENDLLNNPFRVYLKVVDTAADNRLVAYGKWVLSMPDEDGSRFPAWPADCDAKKNDDFFGALARERERLLGGTKNYYLDMLAVHPDYQGKGAGSLIVKWGCDRGDQDGVALYIDATPAGARLYEKFGFEDRSDPRYTAEGIASMVRDARK
ncbi:hypothetical protein VTN00DRAFT_2916 [Thermoascus crustaceus]|uniref:uncharacterized protein n=1 Tax=Thermoascus crustaceus TaxID=5088 RepID=UPI0037423FC7